MKAVMNYFTFGSGDINEGWCQPIVATSAKKAREHMFRLHGDKWCFQYSEAKWQEMKNEDRWWPIEQEKDVVFSEIDNPLFIALIAEKGLSCSVALTVMDTLQKITEHEAEVLLREVFKLGTAYVQYARASDSIIVADGYYTVEITETYVHPITVKAASAKEAVEKVKGMYRDDQIVLSANDCSSVGFSVESEVDE